MGALEDENCLESAGFLMTRQPVFDRRLEPWGTAMRFAMPGNESRIFCDESSANMLLEAYLPQRGETGSRTLVGFPAESVLQGIPQVLWPEGIVLEIEESSGIRHGIVKAVADLKAAGFGIAVSGFRNSPGCGGLNALADVLMVDCADDERSEEHTS